MRLTRRARVALLVAASSAMLTAGTTAIASPASAAAYGCRGGSCTGYLPSQKGCDQDATTKRSLTLGGYADGRNYTIQLRYSPGCRAAWARISAYYPRNREFWVFNNGTKKTEHANGSGGPAWTITRMVGNAGTKAHACMYINNGVYGGYVKECTNWYTG